MRRTYSKGFGVKAKNEPSAIQIIGINPKLGNQIYTKKRVMTGKERKNNRIPQRIKTSNLMQSPITNI